MEATGNEQKDRSLFFAILVPMLLLILAEVLLLSAILWASGIVGRLNQNDCDNMDTQVASRAEYFQNYLQSLDEPLRELSDAVNASTAELIRKGDVSIDALDSNTSQSTKVLVASIEPMVGALRESSASGVFVVLNTQDLSSGHDTGAYGRKSGVYLYDSNPAGLASRYGDDLTIERGPAEVVQSASISTGANWGPYFDFEERVYSDEHDFLYMPFQTAYDASGAKTSMDYACWSVSPAPNNSLEPRCMTYSVPLVLGDGTVFGVAGISLSAGYLKSLLPYEELTKDGDSSFLLARVDAAQLRVAVGDDLQLSPVVCAGVKSVENTQYGSLFSMVRGSGSSSAYHTVNGQYYISAEQLDLYKSNTPISHQEWILAGIAPQSTLHRFTDQTVGMMGMATLLMLLLGFGGTILVGRRVANPLRSLSQEVAQAELEGSETIHLSKTGISEVDQLTGAISTLSANVASARALEQQRLEYERDFDLLTGLMNRRAFYRRAEGLFASPETLKQAAIVMLDLDNLKTINDVYGHDCGDKYIHQAARCFETAVPSNVLVARVSGDEFFLLFYGYDDRRDIESDIEKLRLAIPATEFVLPDGTTTYINASGGVALYLEDANEFMELMKLADFTMYQVKESGKNNIAYFDFDTYQRKSSALRAAAELDDLLDDFKLANYHFQPIFDARTGEVRAYEALMRVSLGMLGNPAEVIALAREKGRLREVERMTWVRSLECFEALREDKAVSGEAYLFINSFASLSLGLDEFAEIAAQHKDLMGNVVIEITENEDMDEQATALKRQVPGTPGLFALDDFGSGYNSDLKLLTLHPKFVKVDISIIRDIHKSADKQRLVSQVVEYAHERDMLIVAEGIETADELDMLLSLNVDLLQGYFLSTPAAVPGPLSDVAASRIAGGRA